MPRLCPVIAIAFTILPILPGHLAAAADPGPEAVEVGGRSPMTLRYQPDSDGECALIELQPHARDGIPEVVGYESSHGFVDTVLRGRDDSIFGRAVVGFGAYTPQRVAANAFVIRKNKGGRIELRLGSGVSAARAKRNRSEGGRPSVESGGALLAPFDAQGRAKVCAQALIDAAKAANQRVSTVEIVLDATAQLAFLDDGIVESVTKNNEDIGRSQQRTAQLVVAVDDVGLPAFLKRRAAARLDLEAAKGSAEASCRHLDTYADEPTAPEAQKALARLQEVALGACRADAEPTRRRACIEEYLRLPDPCVSGRADVHAELLSAWWASCATGSADQRLICLKSYVMEPDLKNAPEARTALWRVQLEQCSAHSEAERRLTCLPALEASAPPEGKGEVTALLDATTTPRAAELAAAVGAALDAGNSQDADDGLAALDGLLKRGVQAAAEAAAVALAPYFDTRLQMTRAALARGDAATAVPAARMALRLAPLVTSRRPTALKDGASVAAGAEALRGATVEVGPAECLLVEARVLGRPPPVEALAGMRPDVQEATNEFERQNRIDAARPEISKEAKRIAKATIHTLEFDREAGPIVLGEYDFKAGGFPLSVLSDRRGWKGPCRMELALPRGFSPILRIPRTDAEQFLARLGDDGSYRGRRTGARFFFTPVKVPRRDDVEARVTRILVLVGEEAPRSIDVPWK